MRNNPIQFATVREDPSLELEVLTRYPRQNALIIGSGGCTALSLNALLPSLKITVLDPNPAQLQLIEAKVHALENLSGWQRLHRFNVESNDPDGLSECGNFESLFRGLRRFLWDLVMSEDDMHTMFTQPLHFSRLSTQLINHPYWPVVFQMYFCEPLLNTMFGPQATQHAPSNSYPAYFQRRFEDGLKRSDAFDNPFLHHVLVGHYFNRPAALPAFLRGNTPAIDLTHVCSTIDDSVDLTKFDFIGLSNILDWMDTSDIQFLLEKIRSEANQGTIVMWRQLNNTEDLRGLLRTNFNFDDAWCHQLWQRDQSLFYNRVNVGIAR